MTENHKSLQFTISVAVVAFVLGVLATRVFDGLTEPPLAAAPPPSLPSSPPAPDSPMPIVAIDAGVIELLPDASLRLDRPADFDFDASTWPPD